MADTTERRTSPIPWRIVGWGSAGTLLLLPAVAMQVTREVVWTASDVAAMGAMLLLAGLALEGLMRASRSLPYRVGAGIAVSVGFLLVWVNLAVGFLGSENNAANLMFAAVLMVAVAGSFLARFRARAMAAAMVVTAAVQITVAVVGFASGIASPGSAGVFEVVMGSTLFGGLWLAAATLFLKAARTSAAAKTG